MKRLAPVWISTIIGAVALAAPRAQGINANDAMVRSSSETQSLATAYLSKFVVQDDVSTGVLSPGGSFVGVGGVKISAPASGLAGPVNVTIQKINPATLKVPLMDFVTPVGEFYEITVPETVYSTSRDDFSIELPVPEGEDPLKLSVADLFPIEYVLLPAPETGAEYKDNWSTGTINRTPGLKTLSIETNVLPEEGIFLVLIKAIICSWSGTQSLVSAYSSKFVVQQDLSDSGVLQPGGQVKFVNGVTVQAPTGSIAQPATVSSKTIPPNTTFAAPALGTLEPIAIYEIGAQPDLYSDGDPFTIGLPIPPEYIGKEVFIFSLGAGGYLLDSEPSDYRWFESDEIPSNDPVRKYFRISEIYKSSVFGLFARKSGRAGSVQTTQVVL